MRECTNEPSVFEASKRPSLPPHTTVADLWPLSRSASRGYAVALIVHHVYHARPDPGLHHPGGKSRQRRRGWGGHFLFLLCGVQRAVAEWEGDAVVWVVHHALYALHALLDLGVSCGD